MSAEPARLDGLQLSSCDTTSEGYCCLRAAAGCPMEEGGRQKVGRIRRLTVSWMKLGNSHPFGWGAAPAAGPQAVDHPPCRDGFGGAHGCLLPDRIWGLFSTASQLSTCTLYSSTPVDV